MRARRGRGTYGTKARRTSNSAYSFIKYILIYIVKLKPDNHSQGILELYNVLAQF